MSTEIAAFLLGLLLIPGAWLILWAAAWLFRLGLELTAKMSLGSLYRLGPTSDRYRSSKRAAAVFAARRGVVWGTKRMIITVSLGPIDDKARREAASKLFHESPEPEEDSAETRAARLRMKLDEEIGRDTPPHIVKAAKKGLDIDYDEIVAKEKRDSE